MGSLERLTREYSSGRRVMDGNLAEGFGDQAAQLLGAVEHLSERIRRCVSEGRIPLGPPCRRHGRQWAAWAPKIRRRLPAMTLGTSGDYRHDQLGPYAPAHGRKVAVDRAHERREIQPSMVGQIRPQVIAPATPFVHRSAPVPPRIVQAPGRDLDQALVEARLRTLAVGHPLVLPDLMRIPVAAGVKELDTTPQAWGHEYGGNR